MPSNKFPNISSNNNNIFQLKNIDSLDETIRNEQNPFSLMKNKSLIELKHINSKKSIRQSRFQSKTIKPDFDCLENVFIYTQQAYNILKACGRNSDELESSSDQSICSNKIADKIKFKHVSLPKFIDTKRLRNVSNLEKLTQNHEFRLLDDVIKMEEEHLESRCAKIDYNNDWHHINLHRDCALTSLAMSKAEQTLRTRQKITEQVRKSLFTISTLKSESMKIEESWKKLLSFKQFLNSCKTKLEAYRQEDRSKFEEVANEDNAECEKRISVLKEKKKDMDMDLFESICNNTEPETLETLNSYMKTDKNQVQIFSHPEDFVQMIEEIEYHNLSVFENVQSEEKSFEKVKQMLTWEKINQENKIAQLKELRTIENERSHIYLTKINALEGRLKELDDYLSIDRFRSAFKFNPNKSHTTINEALEDIFLLTDETICKTMKPNNYCVNDLKMMLRSIELYVDNLHLKISTLDQETLMKCKKSQEDHKRQVSREMMKERDHTSLEMRIKKVLDKADQPIKKRQGRPIVYRSQPPRPPIKVISVDSELERMEEEKRIFFT